MPYKWQKYGLVIVPNKKVWWRRTHAMMPTLFQAEGIYKIYFAVEEFNQSHVGYALIDLEEPSKVLEYSPEPVLNPAALEHLTTTGASVMSTTVGSEILMYMWGLSWWHNSYGLVWRLGFNERGAKF